ncbi:UNVERIFIED_CONTAM: hypothetical protein FKN15_068747, partial [Acipenser sinensis]
LGILTQETEDDNLKPFGKTYIPSSYVKYLESAGCRVTPVKMMFIGGAVNLLTSDFAKAAAVFYKLALKAYVSGDYFPLWGTCLGFQLLTALVAGDDLLTNATVENKALPLKLTAGKKYPFYGVQWHPEVSRFQWHPDQEFPHSVNAVRVSYLTADFFVNEARRSSHHFSSAKEEDAALIYNYSPLYVGNISSYMQIYFF